jgi:ribonuclease P protein component
MEHIRKRKDFLAAARARSQARASLVVQVRDRGDDGPARLGLTTTRKLGNAVARNRIRRRLRAAARAVLAPRARAGHDYVLIGRTTTAQASYQALVSDLGKAIEKLHPRSADDRTAGNGAKP